ncbi:hypothetical protein FQZ97_534160 [compost metagenome]
MLPGQARRQVDTGNHVRVVKPGTGAITPRVGGIEAVAVALLGRIASTGQTDASTTASCEASGTWQSAGAEYRVAAEAQIGAIGVAQTVDAVVANLPNQSQAAGTPDLINELGRGDLRLQNRLALVSIDHTAGRAGGGGWRDIAASDKWRGCTVNGPVQQVRGVDLQRHVWPVAELTTQRGATEVSLEAQAVKPDVFRIVNEVMCTTCHIQCVRRRARSLSTQSAQERASAVIVHHVGAEFGVVELRHEPA